MYLIFINWFLILGIYFNLRVEDIPREFIFLVLCFLVNSFFSTRKIQDFIYDKRLVAVFYFLGWLPALLSVIILLKTMM